MLRHIILVSLAMTACATLISTKANAATLTVTTSDTLRKKNGDSIIFEFSFNPGPENGQIQRLNFQYDNSELSFDPSKTLNVLGTDTTVEFANTQPIAKLTFNVLNPRKDGQSDLFSAFAWYQITDNSGNSQVIATSFANGSFDVEPVPEPVTIFGTATALGCGALFKRKFSRKTLS